MNAANARMFACEACGSMVDWMNAFKRAAARERHHIEPGDACTSKACCSRGDRRYREAPHIASQLERLEGLAAGTHTLVHRPPDTLDMRVHIAGGKSTSRMVKRACKRLRELTAEHEAVQIPTPTDT